MIKPSTLNLIFLIVGFIGLVVCLYFGRRPYSIPWLIAIGLFGYFVISSLREILLNMRGR